MSNNRNGFEVAVIGMAGRFPGAGDLRKFWENLRDGVESIAFLSDQEVLAANADPAWLRMPNYVKAGGILEGIEYFDAAFFGYSPREAEVMDPQHRLFLECAWEALEDSGYSSDVGENVIGVFAGAGMSGYLINIYSNPAVNAAKDAFQVIYGNDKDYITTRVCYKLNLRGPGVTVQTACSTSLVATHLGYQSLLSGACDMALVGGVTISAAQKIGYFYQEGGILSPDGHTRAFDAGAQGCVGGNGLGIVVLKRLEDALADGDSIRAVIKGSAINNDGSLKVGYTAPSVDGQGAVIKAALAMAGVGPETVTYVETHGTGTSLGDPVEIAGLNLAYGTKGRKRHSCALGAVKTNIGHLDTAAGVAGLIKTILALEHEQIPPSLNFQLPNPRIDFDGGPFYVNTALTEWETFGHPRRAGVSSFGIGGTNAHVIIEEAPAPRPSWGSRPWQLLLLSAKTESALEEMTSRLAEHFEQHPSLSLADAAYTLQVGRRTFPHRRAVLCENLDDAVAALRERPPQRVKTGMKPPQNPSVVFMFPGQGAQYVGMGFELYQAEPTFRQQVDSCCDLLKPDIGFDLRSVLYPGEQAAEAGLQLRQTLVTQTALFVIEYALAKLWIEWGVRPRAMIGHSLGEYVAACLAGVFSLEEALRLVATRGRLMAQSPAGGMLAVPLPEQEVASLVISKPLSLAAVNTPSQCVIAGASPVVEEFARQLDERAISYKPLEVSHAFHSEMMEPVLKPFLDQIGGVNFKAPEIPYISNVTGTWVTEAESTDPRYWANHLRQTVRFSDGLKVLLKEQKYVMLELGPGQSLSKLVKQHLDKSPGQIALASLPDRRRSESEMHSMLSALGRLWISGVSVDWSAFYAQQRRRRVPLPTYPFERKRYWVERGGLTREPDTPQPSLLEKPNPADAEADPGRLSTSAYLRPDLDTAYVAPRNDEEAALAEIWRQQLGIERVGVNDNFFELGGDSVISIQIVAKASQAGLRLSPKHLFEYPTIAELAQVACPAQAIKAEQGLVSGSLPLTPIQCWFFESDLADAHHFNQAILLAARQRIELIPLERAVAQLLLHHDALRLRFVRDESGWRQFIASDEPPVEVIRVDLTSVPGGELSGAIEAAAAQLQTSLDFCGGPLMRVALFEPSGHEPQRLLIVVHHLAIDGLSWRILLEDLQEAYRAAGCPIQLPPKTTSFKSWAERLKEYAESDALDQEVRFWLDDARKQVKRLPVDFPGGDNTSASGQAVSVSLNVEETRALLLDVPPAYNTQINDSLLAALAMAVRQWTGETPVLVDMEGHGREEVVEEVDLSRTVGWFTTIYPVALTVGDGHSPGDALKRVKEELRRIPNNGIGYGLLKYLSPKREIAEALRALPPAEVSFLYLGQLDQVLDGDAAFAPARESSGPSRSPNGRRQYLFEVSAMVLGEELRVTWVYSENLHRRETVENLAHGFVDNLRRIIAHCQSPAAGGYTPSDFPLAGLDEDGLRGLLDGVEFEAE